MADSPAHNGEAELWSGDALGHAFDDSAFGGFDFAGLPGNRFATGWQAIGTGGIKGSASVEKHTG